MRLLRRLRDGVLREPAERRVDSLPEPKIALLFRNGRRPLLLPRLRAQRAPDRVVEKFLGSWNRLVCNTHLIFSSSAPERCGASADRGQPERLSEARCAWRSRSPAPGSYSENRSHGRFR